MLWFDIDKCVRGKIWRVKFWDKSCGVSFTWLWFAVDYVVKVKLCDRVVLSGDVASTLLHALAWLATHHNSPTIRVYFRAVILKICSTTGKLIVIYFEFVTEIVFFVIKLRINKKIHKHVCLVKPWVKLIIDLSRIDLYLFCLSMFFASFIYVLKHLSKPNIHSGGKVPAMFWAGRYPPSLCNKKNCERSFCNT